MSADIWLGAVIAGIFTLLGGILGVWLSNHFNGRFHKRRAQEEIFSLFVNTAGTPDAPDYSKAVRLIWVHFANERSVMEKYRSYIECTNTPPDQRTEQHSENTIKLQSELQLELAKALGYKGVKIEDFPFYQSVAHAEFVNLNYKALEAVQAFPKIAESLEQQVELTRSLVAGT